MNEESRQKQMVDEFESMVKASGKSGAVQAMALACAIIQSFKNFSEVAPGAIILMQHGEQFRDGFAACAGAINECLTALAEHAQTAEVFDDPEHEGFAQHIMPADMHGTFASILAKYLAPR